MSRVFRFSAFLAVLVVPLSAEDPSRYIKLFEDTYRRAGTLQATFLEQYSEAGRVERVESGVAYFRRPGKMRWEYESPEKNLFLVDGKNAWFYVPSDHTVTRVAARKSADWRTPLALLAGEMKLSRICASVRPTVNLKPESLENIVLYCELRGQDAELRKAVSQEGAADSDGSEKAVFFEIVRKTGNLVRVMVQESGGIAIEFHFTNWLDDPPVKEALFHFSVPSGVAIVNGETPDGNTP